MMKNGPTPIERAKWLLYKDYRKHNLLGSPLTVIRFINKAFGHSIEPSVLLTLFKYYEKRKESIMDIDITLKEELPQISTPIQKTLAEIQEIEGALNLITTRVLALIPHEDCKAMIFNELTELLETRRHRIMEQLKISFKPEDYTKLDSEPGIENRQAPGK